MANGLGVVLIGLELPLSTLAILGGVGGWFAVVNGRGVVLSGLGVKLDALIGCFGGVLGGVSLVGAMLPRDPGGVIVPLEPPLLASPLKFTFSGLGGVDRKARGGIGSFARMVVPLAPLLPPPRPLLTIRPRTPTNSAASVNISSSIPSGEL